MKIKYVAADLHKATTTIAVKDENGKTIRRSVMETTEENLRSEIEAIPGTVHLTFEESQYANWMYDALRPLVDKLVVCEPRHNRLLSSGDKNDELDADQLADLLRAGLLKPVYHGEQSKRDLRELVKSYDQLISDRTRTKNRINALFSGRGIKAPEGGLYATDLEARTTLIKKLPGRGMRQRAMCLYVELNCQDQLVKEARKEMLAEGKKFPGVARLRTVPGFGPIRATQAVAWIQTPHRFRTKGQFRKYVGLAVVSKSSSDWVVTESGFKRETRIQTRGLNQKFHRPLKAIFKGAAKDAATRNEAWKNHQNALIGDGMRPDLARLTIARKLASIVLTVWKQGVDYDESKTNLRS